MADMAIEAPKSSKTIDTVVEVGSARELKRSSNNTSVIITAKKRIIISSKVNCQGLKMPLRATSIKPEEKTAPIATPKLATIKIVLKDAAFEPTAALRKLTASLLTPTTRSTMARKNKAANMKT